MSSKYPIKNLPLFLLLIFVSACSNSNTTPTAAAVASSTETPVVTVAPAVTETSAATEAAVTAEGGMPVAGPGSCANPYYPVREGSTWFYESSGSPNGKYSMNETIISLREGGFVLQRTFNGVTGTQDWSCTPQGLVAMQFGGGTLILDNLKLEIESQNVSGVIYPPQIHAGDQWDYALNFTGKMNLTGTPGAATGSVKNHFTALGVESVSVPAGTFEAMKIQFDTTFDANVELQGIPLPVALSSTYYYWYAQGVGWVKAEGSGTIAGQTFNETLELQAYNLP